MEHGSLQHALEAQRRLHFALLALLEPWSRLVYMLFELLLQLTQIGAARTQYLAHFRRIQDREQQVLDSQVFVTCLTRLMERIVETVFKLVGQHFRRTSFIWFHCRKSPAALSARWQKA